MMRAMEVEVQVIQDIDIIVYVAITADDCQGWITDKYFM